MTTSTTSSSTPLDGDCAYAALSPSLTAIAAVPTGNADYPDYLVIADGGIRTVSWTHWPFAPLTEAAVATFGE